MKKFLHFVREYGSFVSALPSKLKFYEVAETGGADCLVTVNLKDFPRRELK